MVKEYEARTYVLTAAQGIQTPQSASSYGRDASKGAPNENLIENIEKYTRDQKGDLRILCIAGSYVNEIEMDPFFQSKENIYMYKKTFARLQSQRDLEELRRELWEIAKEKAEFSERDFNRRCPEKFFWGGEIPDTEYPDIDKKLNRKVGIIGIPEPPQNRDPTSGNTDLTSHLEESVIFGSPKQRLKPVAKNMNGKYPRIIMTTGCCTHPNYNETNNRGNRAARDHQYGFTVVDVLGNELYLPRLVPARKDGTFVDMGIKYSSGKDPEKVNTAAFVIGDPHIPNQDPKAIKATGEMIDDFQPKQIYIHDGFDSQEVNGHNADDELINMWNYEEGISNLEKGVSLYRDFLIEIAERAPYAKIFDVASNHADMIRRWLASGRYRNDRENARFAHKIMAKIKRNDWPLETAVKLIGDIPKNVKFLTLTSDYKPWGYQTSAHGHKGPNGARGSLKSLATAYGKVIIGHVHQLEVMGNAISVGTNAKIPMEYQKGQPSTSMHGNAVIYDGGLVQALPIINGIWKK
ncbi:hypothetical protein J4474_03895 [Candidatus Pacearchaeota archaeon]|nr:hypothetical protein [Candidatus Pacearchaeota archaeon]